MVEEKLLGDVVEDVAKKLNIDRLRDSIERLTRKQCNCGKRKEQLNNLHRQLKKLIGE